MKYHPKGRVNLIEIQTQTIPQDWEKQVDSTAFLKMYKSTFTYKTMAL